MTGTLYPRHCLNDEPRAIPAGEPVDDRYLAVGPSARAESPTAPRPLLFWRWCGDSTVALVEVRTALHVLGAHRTSRCRQGGTAEPQVPVDAHAQVSPEMMGRAGPGHGNAK